MEGVPFAIPPHPIIATFSFSAISVIPLEFHFIDLLGFFLISFAAFKSRI